MGWRVALCVLGNTHGVARLSFLMKTIIIGLGNPILGDDGVGWKVAEQVKKQIPPALAVAIEFLSLGGISLMEHLIGYQRAILIDAIASDLEPGSVITSKLTEMPDVSAFHITSAHDTSLQNALKLGKAMGADLPEQVTVVGIATNHVYDFSEELSLPVAQAISKATQIVIDLL
jgi:hydrogenase maturation protease